MAICMHMASYHDRGRRGCRCIGLLPFEARGLFAIAFGNSAHGAMSMPQVRVRCCDSCSAFLLSTNPLVSLGWPHYAWPRLAWPNFPSLKVHHLCSPSLASVSAILLCSCPHRLLSGALHPSIEAVQLAFYLTYLLPSLGWRLHHPLSRAP